MGSSPILIVEDDELVRAFLARALSDVAGDVVECDNGDDALRLADTHAFGLVLLDGLLPDMHGIELARTLIRDRQSQSGICFVSGTLRHARPAQAGVAALPKPLRVRELLTTANELLSWHDAAQAGDAAERLAVIDSLAADVLVSRR